MIARWPEWYQQQEQNIPALFTKCYNIDIVMIASKAFNRNHVMEHIDLDEKGAFNDPSTRLSKQKVCLRCDLLSA